MTQFYTPTLGMRGAYEIMPPFLAQFNGDVLSLTCVSIRSFQDMFADDIDVFADYYAANGLTAADFTRDVNAKVPMVALQTPSGLKFVIPASYIGRKPVGNTVPYGHIVLSISLGALPLATDLTFLKTQLANTCSDVIGKTAEVKVNYAPVVGDTAVTTEQHNLLETARIAAINMRSTDYGRNLTLQQVNDSLLQQIHTLEQICIAHNLLP